MLTIAVIGAGQMGRNHIRVCGELADVQLVGVADPNEEVRGRIAHAFRVPTFASVEELLEGPNPDAFVVAVPTSLHLAIALPLLEAGKHVLVEKPIADTVENGRRLVEAARNGGAILFVGHIERFNPAVIELKRRLDEGVLGKLYQMHARRIGPFPPRIQDVGVTVDLATHDLNVMQRITNSRVLRISAETEQRLHSRCEDAVSALVRFESGVLGTLDVNWLTPTKVRELWVGGERGMFHVNYLTQDLTFFENGAADPGSLNVLHVMGISEGRAIRYPVRRVEPLRAELEQFVHCIRTGAAPSVGGTEAVETLQLALDIVAAASHRS